MKHENIYTKSASFYDAIYKNKNYREEASYVHRIIQGYKKAEGNALLDIACGTGGHIPHLLSDYDVQGLDLNLNMLAVARSRNPNVRFHAGDMSDFKLNQQFDAVICLFSAIGYVRTVDRLYQTIANFSRHTKTGGVLIVEPWDKVWEYMPGLLNAAFVDQPDMKVARMCRSRIEDGLSKISVHYLVSTIGRIEYFVEEHELAIFSQDDYLAAFEEAGFSVTYDSEGVSGRGLYIGVKTEKRKRLTPIAAQNEELVDAGTSAYL